MQSGIRSVAWLVVLTCWGQAAEKTFDFGSQSAGQIPEGFGSFLTGEGEPGDWQIKEVALESVSQSSVTTREAVVAQLAQERVDEHFPMLVYEREAFGDFTAVVRAKAVSGEMEQMAGLVFRVLDERNYYVLRLSALGDTVRFYKVVEGIRSPPIGVQGRVELGVWHELKVSCRGNQIRCWFNGTELFPVLTDNSFTEGGIGFWTKSDSVSYFKDLRLVYTPHESLAQRLVRETFVKYGRLVGLELYAARPGREEINLIAGNDPEKLGEPAGEVEREVALEAKLFYGKSDGTVTVVMPLRDRNGDPVAAVRVIMKSFPGQTQKNAFARAKPIVDRMSAQVLAAKDLFR